MIFRWSLCYQWLVSIIKEHDIFQMLKPRALTSVLAQANTDGILSTFLFKQDGTLLGYSSIDQGCRAHPKHSQDLIFNFVECSDPRVVSAISSKIWNLYEKSGRACLNEDKLELLLLDCEDGHVGVVPVNSSLLCLYGDKSVGFGMIKSKSDALVKFLEEPLSQVGVLWCDQMSLL